MDIIAFGWQDCGNSEISFWHIGTAPQSSEPPLAPFAPGCCRARSLGCHPTTPRHPPSTLGFEKPWWVVRLVTSTWGWCDQTIHRLDDHAWNPKYPNIQVCFWENNNFGLGEVWRLHSVVVAVIVLRKYCIYTVDMFDFCFKVCSWVVPIPHW